MTKKEFMDIMGAIDKGLIESTLDIETPYDELFTNDTPQKVYIRKTPHKALRFSVCAAACAAVLAGVTIIIKNVSKTPVTPPLDITDSSSDITSVSVSEINNFPQITTKIVSDQVNTDDFKIKRNDLSYLNVIQSSSGVECEHLLDLQASDNYASIREIFTDEGGITVLANSDRGGNDYLFNFDKDGKAATGSHEMFSGPIDGLYEDHDYTDNRVFTSTRDLSELKFYDKKTYEAINKLPECCSADMVLFADVRSEKNKYLYITEDKKTLNLYTIANNYNSYSLSASDFMMGTDWEFESVNVVSPELATITISRKDGSSEKYRTYLLEFPTLKIIQNLSDDCEVTALDDGNFLIAQRGTSSSENELRIYRAKFQNGELVKTDENYISGGASANVLLSPGKKTAVICEARYGKARYTAISAEDFHTVWDIELDNEGYMTDFSCPAAVTDDAVLYISGKLGFQLSVYRIACTEAQ